MSTRKTLKTLVNARRGAIVPGAFNALSARVIEDLGFEAVYVTGAGVTNMNLGLPDQGFMGLAEIAEATSRIRDAVQHLKDRTFEGMNAGVDLWTLMDQIKLPPELDVGQGHGKVPWIVRAIWEEHLGWFRFESTTELYNVPPSAVSPDLVELAGGPAPVVARGRQKLEAGRPLEALHLAEAVLAADAGFVEALRLKLAATEALLAASTRENFSEVRWLESEIARIERALGEPA